ncbi:MAG: 4-hydroxyphenylpyruvate dioxygenase, partial [Cyclobacteriaceae bacterium]
METKTLTAAEVKLSDDFMPINGTDYLELYVSNARQAAHY